MKFPIFITGRKKILPVPMAARAFLAGFLLLGFFLIPAPGAALARQAPKHQAAVVTAPAAQITLQSAPGSLWQGLYGLLKTGFGLLAEAQSLAVKNNTVNVSQTSLSSPRIGQLAAELGGFLAGRLGGLAQNNRLGPPVATTAGNWAHKVALNNYKIPGGQSGAVPPQGEVLSASTVKQISPADLTGSIEAILNEYLKAGKFTGPAGAPGDATVADDDNGNSNVVIAGIPIMTYSANDGDSVAGFGELSGSEFSANDIVTNTVTANSTSYLADVNASGNITAAAFIGDGSQLTGINGEWVTATSTSNIFYNPGNVGIGTTSPGTTLSILGNGGNDILNLASSSGQSVFSVDVNGNVGIGATGTDIFGDRLVVAGNNTGAQPYVRMALNNPNTTNGTSFRYYNGSVLGAAIVYNNTDSQFQVSAYSTSSFTTFDTAGIERVRIDNSGNLVVGTTTSSAILTVQGTSTSAALLNIASSTGTGLFYVGNNGNVGIGTTSPRVMLHVGSAAAGGSVRIANGYLCVDNNDTCSGANTAGGIYSVSAATTGADVAENYPTNDTSLEAGDVVAANPGFPIYVSKATSTSPILGIVSTKPGVLLNGYKAQDFASASTVPVALAGRVPVKVSNENGAITVGDYLAPSVKFPGMAMKAVAAGFVLGRALESFSASASGSTGSILVFIQPMQYEPKVSDLLQAGDNSDTQAWLQSLANLNQTQASVFGDIAVEGSLLVQKDLTVGGLISAATLKVDTINAKKLCLDDVCITKDELVKLLQLENQSAAPAPASQTPNPPATSSPDASSPIQTSSTTPDTAPAPAPTPDPTLAPDLTTTTNN